MNNKPHPELQWRRLWLSVGYLLVLNVLLLSLAPLDGAPILTIAYSDKVAHALVFMLLMIWFSGLMPARYYPRLFLALLAYGALIEFLQQFTPYRSLELLDLGADMLGLFLGWALAVLGLNTWPRRLEKLVRRS